MFSGIELFFSSLVWKWCRLKVVFWCVLVLLCRVMMVVRLVMLDSVWLGWVMICFILVLVLLLFMFMVFCR